MFDSNISNSVVVAVSSAFVGGIIVFLLLNESESPEQLIHAKHDGKEANTPADLKPRRTTKPDGLHSESVATARRMAQEAEQEAADLRTQLAKARTTINELNKQIALDDDIPPMEPKLGLTARQEFRIQRLIEVGEAKAVKEHQESVSRLIEGKTSEGVQGSKAELFAGLKGLSRNRKLTKRNVFVRELGEDAAFRKYREALEYRDQVLAGAKSKKHRNTLKSIFVRQNKLATALIEAFTPDHH